MAADDREVEFARWLASLHELTDSPDDSRRWRERRSAFAYRLGQKLVSESETRGDRLGPVLYGVWLSWGLLYVGQTTEGSRRLRDLPIGESHHLANTFPPEIWDRVVVINWPALPEAQAALAQHDHMTIGLALEHHVQLRARPMANGFRRKSDGGWRQVDRHKSKSRGARAAAAIGALAQTVDQLWDLAASHEAGSTELPSMTRCIRPVEMLKQGG